jgi:hypothetical protein
MCFNTSHPFHVPAASDHLGSTLVPVDRRLAASASSKVGGPSKRSQPVDNTWNYNTPTGQLPALAASLIIPGQQHESTP